MTFKETKLKAVLNEIDTGKLLIADEIETICDDALKRYSDETYEAICEYAYEMYLDTDYTANEIAIGIHYLLTDEELSVKQIIELSKSEFIELAIRFI